MRRRHEAWECSVGSPMAARWMLWEHSCESKCRCMRGVASSHLIRAVRPLDGQVQSGRAVGRGMGASGVAGSSCDCSSSTCAAAAGAGALAQALPDAMHFRQ